MSRMKLSDIVNFNPATALKKGSLSPFIEMAALTEYKRDVGDIQLREFKGGGSKFINGDVLFARITPCLENGKTAKVSGLPQNTSGHGSTEFIVMRAKFPDIDEDFIYYVARDESFRAYAKSRMEGTSGRQRVSWQAIANYALNEIAPQDRKTIGSLLRSFDDKILLNDKINQTLEEMAQAIFKSWFVDFDPVKAKVQVIAQGGSEQEANLAAMQIISGKTRDQLAALEHTHPEQYTQLHTTATLFPSAFVDSELGEIPEGWEVKTLGELTSYLSRGISPKYTEGQGTIVINQKCVRDFKVDLSKARLHNSNLKKVDGRLLVSGDVLVNSTGVGTLGRVAQIEISGEEIIVDSHVTVVRANELISSEYLGQLMLFLQPAIQEMGEGTTGQTELSRAKLAELKCLTPSKGVLSIFSNFIAPVRSRISNNQKKSTTLANSRDSLLPKLLSGEIDVSQLNLGD